VLNIYSGSLNESLRLALWSTMEVAAKQPTREVHGDNIVGGS
jgi:hypothetical protein